MTLVGGVDISIGILTLIQPVRAVILYMVVWGLQTAALRPLAGEGAWELLERAGNYSVPLAFLLLLATGRSVRDWVSFRPAPNLTPDRAAAIEWTLRVTTACLLIVSFENSVRCQVLDLSALIRRTSRLDDHAPAPPASTASPSLRRSPRCRPGKLGLAPQLAVYKKMVSRPRLRRSDRVFWVALSRAWAGWRRPLVIVTPDTVLRWQRRRFREYWTRLSARPIAGRPPVNAEIKALVTRMAAANPLWGAPRITGNFSGWGSTSASAPSRGCSPTGAPRPLRPGGRF
jgi:hypothetical protein